MTARTETLTRKVGRRIGTVGAASARTVVGRVRRIDPIQLPDRKIWRVRIGEAGDIAISDPLIARALGASGEELPTVPVEVDIVDRKGISFAVSARLAGEDLRRSRAVDLTDPDIIARMAEADAVDALTAANALMRGSVIAERPSAKAAQLSYETWKQRNDVGSQEWIRSLAEALNSARKAAEEGLRSDLQGSFHVQQICRIAVQSLVTARRDKRSAPDFFGSSAIGQLHDYLPGSRIGSATSVAWAAFRTIERTVPEEVKDRNLILGMIHRAASADTEIERSKELRGALTWAWKVIRKRHTATGNLRYAGPLGAALRNIETAIQWVGGDIPDLGPFKTLPGDFATSKQPNFVRALAYQKARGNTIVKVDTDADGNVIAHCMNDETAVFRKDGSSSVFDKAGEVIFDSGNEEVAQRAMNL